MLSDWQLGMTEEDCDFGRSRRFTLRARHRTSGEVIEREHEVRDVWGTDAFAVRQAAKDALWQQVVEAIERREARKGA